ncbi:hypothetical protein [Streptomyces sp. NPDC020141]|uniref:hypothetical protein n=1 Tax=Streptomyces sp. NPDC020141 TaxID=3365065 RepID=UPI0037A89877
MKKTSALAAAAITASLLVFPSSPATAKSASFDRTVKCEQKDRDGRKIPTRVGNSVLGWKHFSGRHNIRKCGVVNGPLDGKVDKVKGARLEYYGYAWQGTKRVKLVVIVQYARKTDDGKHDAGKGKKIGVITAYCKNMKKCPDWVNH